MGQQRSVWARGLLGESVQWLRALQCLYVYYTLFYLHILPQCIHFSLYYRGNAVLAGGMGHRCMLCSLSWPHMLELKEGYRGVLCALLKG